MSKDSQIVEVKNLRKSGAFNGIPAGKTGFVEAWVVKAYPTLVKQVGPGPESDADEEKPEPDEEKPEPDEEKPDAQGPRLSLPQLRAAIRESSDLEWLSDRLEDHRPSVVALATERIQELS